MLVSVHYSWLLEFCLSLWSPLSGREKTVFFFFFGVLERKSKRHCSTVPFLKLELVRARVNVSVCWCSQTPLEVVARGACQQLLNASRTQILVEETPVNTGGESERERSAWCTPTLRGAAVNEGEVKKKRQQMRRRGKTEKNRAEKKNHRRRARRYRSSSAKQVANVNE
jgi:hypothetical protein